MSMNNDTQPSSGDLIAAIDLLKCAQESLKGAKKDGALTTREKSDVEEALDATKRALDRAETRRAVHQVDWKELQNEMYEISKRANDARGHFTDVPDDKLAALDLDVFSAYLSEIVDHASELEATAEGWRKTS